MVPVAAFIRVAPYFLREWRWKFRLACRGMRQKSTAQNKKKKGRNVYGNQTRGSCCLLALALPLSAQGPFGSRTPNMSGIWNPVIGSGELTKWRIGWQQIPDGNYAGGQKSEREGRLIGWKWQLADARSGGTVHEVLIAAGTDGMTSTRMICSSPASNHRNDMNLAAQAGRAEPVDSLRHPSKADHVGTETIPSRRHIQFEHYRTKTECPTVWISDKVAPWGLIKSQIRIRP